jgi:hypothetical protein
MVQEAQASTSDLLLIATTCLDSKPPARFDKFCKPGRWDLVVPYFTCSHTHPHSRGAPTIFFRDCDVKPKQKAR